MSIWKEFREFAVKGDVVDLATGVVVGGAFHRIVTSLTQDILMPPIGLVLGRVDFTNLYINLSRHRYPSLAAARAAGAPVIAYGQFINNVLDFLIVAFIVFLLVKEINRVRHHRPACHECPFCTSSIPIKATRCPHCTSRLT